MLFYTVFKFFEQRNLRMRGNPRFAQGRESTIILWCCPLNLKSAQKPLISRFRVQSSCTNILEVYPTAFKNSLVFTGAFTGSLSPSKGSFMLFFRATFTRFIREEVYTKFYWEITLSYLDHWIFVGRWALWAVCATFWGFIWSRSICNNCEYLIACGFLRWNATKSELSQLSIKIMDMKQVRKCDICLHPPEIFTSASELRCLSMINYLKICF